MILVILAVFITLSIVFAVVDHKCGYRSFWNRTADSLSFISFLLASFTLIPLIALIIFTCQSSVIDKQIAMYQGENTKIERQIADVVEQYQEYETGIFTEVAPDSATTLIALYPELKSDELVKAQIETYISNNNAIKELKSKALYGPIYRWWLYFGK